MQTLRTRTMKGSSKISRTVTFSNPTTSVSVGGTVTNVATVSAGASDGTLTYSSSDTSKATVNSSGTVTGVANGSATITASITGGTNYADASSSYNISVGQFEPVVTNYTYTGSKQTATLQPGTYTFECWGAQGGSITGATGGKGGYSVGTIEINSPTTVHVYVGGSGEDASSIGFHSGGFNGGGNSYGTSANYYGGSGGGASDIRIGTDSLLCRVIVAGGGGGAGRYNSTAQLNGGFGGGSTGGNGEDRVSDGAKGGQGGTQSAAGDSYYGTNTKNSTIQGTLADFGIGGGAYANNTSYRTVGGGGGWYGGGYSQRSAAGGGSGYVLTSSSYKPSGYALGSEYYLSNAETIGGDTSFPSTSGGNETGHSGNGYVRITQIG